MWIALGFLAALVLVIGLRLIIRRIGGSRSPVSIVMLRSHPRGLSDADVRGAYRRAFQKEPELNSIPMPDGLTRGIVLTCGDLPALAVIDSTRGYMEPGEVETVAQRFEHAAVRQAILNHKAWVSVDAMGSQGLNREQRQLVYTVLGKLAAELYDEPGTLLLYLPADGLAAEPGPNVESLLRSGRVMELFGDASLGAPLFTVQEDDAEINSAIAEAQRRLPQMLKAFEQSGDASEAMIKARFRTADDGQEMIWLSLVRISDGTLTGTIQNPPIAAGLPPMGSEATIKIEDVVDWAYIDEHGETQGLFVDAILFKRGHR
jgi:uncharacterized protein YegJ (DUF2314 family)